MSRRADDITIPGEPEPTQSGEIRTLTIIASALTTASLLVSVLLQFAHFRRKKPMQPGQRDRVDTAAFALFILRQAPGIIKQVRLLADQLRMEAEKPELP